MKELISVEADSEARKYREMLDENDIACEIHLKTIGNIFRPTNVVILVNEADYEKALKLIED